MSCAALSCRSRTTKGGVKNPEFSFHRFPKCPQIRQQWIKAVKRGNWEPTKNSRLCSKHFKKSCYIGGLARKQLKTNAVPTIFEEYTKSFQPVVRKRKAPADRKETESIFPRKRRRLEESGIETKNIPTTPSKRDSVVDASSSAWQYEQQAEEKSASFGSEGVAEAGDLARSLAALALLRARLPPAAAALQAALPHPPPRAAAPLHQIMQLAALLQCHNHALIDVETALEAAEKQSSVSVGRRQLVPVAMPARPKPQSTKQAKPAKVKEVPCSTRQSVFVRVTYHF